MGIELRECVLGRGSWAVRPLGGDRLERVGDEDDARLERDLVATEAVGVATSVDVLVVMEHPTRFLQSSSAASTTE